MKKILFALFMLVYGSTHAQFSLVTNLTQQMNQDSLLTYVKQLTGLLPIGNQTITSRLKGTAGNTLAEQFIKDKLRSWGVPFDSVTFSVTGTNIIGRIEGRRADKVMMIGAHFDAVGTNNPAFFYPGADDNASGTAAVLEAARVCAGKQFPVTLCFALWDEEEQGLVGSAVSAPEYMGKLAGYINMDMIAYDSNNDSSFDIHTRPSGYSELMASKVFNLVSLYQVPLKPRLINPGDPNTDHGSFWTNNMTAIGINEEYDGDFTPHWHKLTDSLTYFNISYFVRMSRFATTAFLHLAMDTTPLVGLNEQAVTEAGLDVYPNPAERNLYVRVRADATPAQVRLLNMLGEDVSVTWKADAGVLYIENAVPPGVYMVEVIAVGTSGAKATLRRKVVLR